MFRRSDNLHRATGRRCTHPQVFKGTFQNCEKCGSFISLHSATPVDDLPCSDEMMVFYTAFDSGFERAISDV